MREYVISVLGASFVRSQPPFRTGHRTPEMGCPACSPRAFFWSCSVPFLEAATAAERQHSGRRRSSRRTLPPVWSYFGYDEPNYFYPSNGASKSPEDRVRFLSVLHSPLLLFPGFGISSRVA